MNNQNILQLNNNNIMSIFRFIAPTISSNNTIKLKYNTIRYCYLINILIQKYKKYQLYRTLLNKKTWSH